MKKGRKRLSLWGILILAALIGGWCGYKWSASVLLEHRSRNVHVESQYQFGDNNATHLSVAKRNGIKPSQNRDEVDVDGLTKISSCSLYKVASLEHSIPYLTQGAADLLDEIGERFQAALSSQGYMQHRIIVTSMLRTKSDVSRLQKVNGNSTTHSAHLYGTTFDIAYTTFGCSGISGTNVRNQVLTNVLGSVLQQLRKEGRCYVKYERNQRCFHITSRI